MDKKFKFSDQPLAAKITYSSVVAILLITAIVVGMISSSEANKDKTPTDQQPPIVNEDKNDDENKENETPSEDEKEPEEEKPTALVFYAPLAGSIMKSHNVETPVFSETLGDWRVHTGIDIAAEVGTDVLAVADGTVSAVKNDHFLGKTVEISHTGGIVSVYSNLSNDGVTVKVGDSVRAGEKIGTVGDTSLVELADESHLHFEILVSGTSVNPLDYISEESQKSSLGVK